MDELAARGRWWRVAAVVSVLVALFAFAAYDIPTLIDGADASGDPYWIVIGSFASDVVALVAAYGAWRRQLWGVVLLVAVNVYWILQAITTLFDDATNSDIVFSLVMLVAHLAVLWCCLGRPGGVRDRTTQRYAA